MRLLAYLCGGLLAVACAAILLVADSASFFVVSSYWIAALFGGAFALGLQWTMPRPDGKGEKRARFLPFLLILCAVAALPFRNREHKAFYEAFERVERGMTFAEAREVLREYTLARADGDTFDFLYSPDPATVDYVRIRLENGRVVETSYAWD